MSVNESWKVEQQLAEYRTQHEEIRTRVVRLLDGMSSTQFDFAPAPGRWSIAGNIEHLRLVAIDQLEIIENVIGRGWALDVRAVVTSAVENWGDRYLRFTEPPYRVRIPARDRHVPARHVSYIVSVAGFLECKRRMLDLIEVARGLDLARLTAPIPGVDGWTPELSLGQWFALSAAHERRHLWQIETIRTSPGYPAAAPAA